MHPFNCSDEVFEGEHMYGELSDILIMVLLRTSEAAEWIPYITQTLHVTVMDKHRYTQEWHKENAGNLQRLGYYQSEENHFHNIKESKKHYSALSDINGLLGFLSIH